MKQIIFSTCFMPSISHIERWTNWFEYYTELFPEFEIVSFYDGPIPEFLNDFKYRNQLISSGTFLGRPIPGNLWLFPGWKQSFREALTYTIDYDYIIHIESDLYIKRKHKDLYLSKFTTPNVYYAGFCKLHKLTETALQVLNNKLVNKRFIDYYSSNTNLHANACAEHQMIKIAKPEYVFIGERLEKNKQAILNNDSMEYFAQCSYNEFKQYL